MSVDTKNTGLRGIPVADTRISNINGKLLKALTVYLCRRNHSAALIKQAFGGKTVLVDYPGQMEALEEIAKNAKSISAI